MRALLLALANAAAWATLQMSVAWVATRLPASLFTREAPPLHVQPWEPPLYQRLLRVRRWKRLLPDGAAWVGSDFPKKRLTARDPSYFQRFLLETRRGESAHWFMLACTPLFFPWNPRWAWALNTLYALATNLPCIIVQRYNRAVLARLLRSGPAASFPQSPHL